MLYAESYAYCCIIFIYNVGTISACDFVQKSSLTDSYFSDCPHKFNGGGFTLEQCQAKALSIPGGNSINWNENGDCNVKACENVDDPMLKKGHNHAVYVYKCNGKCLQLCFHVLRC